MSSAAESLQTTLASKNLPPGHQRFLTQMGRLLPCLGQAAAAKEPALTLYQSSARQWLFYLQSLCRIYRDVQDKKPFKALSAPIKALEDQLGAVDYWDGWLKDAAAQKDFPEVLHTALERHKADELSKLQTLLDADEWLHGDFPRIRTMMKELAEVDWHKATKDRRKVAEFIAAELEEIEDDYGAGEFDFEELELGVHEFRRKLRWLSIYAQSLEGLIQLRPAGRIDAALQPYMTKAVVESRYNVVPAAATGIEPLYFSAPRFYALSWIIAEIGTIKDDGLKIETLTNLATECGLSANAVAPFLRDCTHTLATIPATVAKIARTFIEENAILRDLRADILR